MEDRSEETFWNKAQRDKKMKNTYKRVGYIKITIRPDTGLWDPRREGKKGGGNMWRGNDWEYPRTEERHQRAELKSSTNLKQKK